MRYACVMVKRESIHFIIRDKNKEKKRKERQLTILVLLFFQTTSCKLRGCATMSMYTPCSPCLPVTNFDLLDSCCFLSGLGKLWRLEVPNFGHFRRVSGGLQVRSTSAIFAFVTAAHPSTSKTTFHHTIEHKRSWDWREEIFKLSGSVEV